MVRLKGNSPHNAFVGKVGNLVGCRWKDTYYIRRRPFSVKHPNTPKQLAQRMRFTKTQEFLLPLKEFLHLGFGAYTSNMSGFNAAMSINLRNAIVGEYPDISVDPSLVLFSQGKLPATHSSEVEVNKAGLLQFTWSTEVEGLAKGNDSVLLIVRSVDDWDGTYKLDVASRSDGMTTMNLEPSLARAEIACYLVFVKKRMLLGEYAKESISDSIFCGTAKKG